MKNLIIDTINQEIRVFNEKSESWQTQKFSELNLDFMCYINFAAHIEEIQETINEHNEYEVVVIFQIFGRTFNVEMFENSIQCKGSEIFDPETNECWYKSANNELLFNCISNDWDCSELELKEISFPDGHGTYTEKNGYEYVLEEGDYDIYDIYKLSDEIITAEE